MIKATTPIADVDSYIAGFPKETQKLLKQLRAIIKKAVPGAEEIISYQMPAYKFHGRLLYFSGFKNHIGFYPMKSTITRFTKEIAGYKHATGSVQFPLDQPLPVELINEMLAFRAKENLEKTSLKGVPKKKISRKK
jgi:uncharacterized protein YdhG (YjbR/CyaY superfamily)